MCMSVYVSNNVIEHLGHLMHFAKRKSINLHNFGVCIEIY